MRFKAVLLACVSVLSLSSNLVLATDGEYERTTLYSAMLPEAPYTVLCGFQMYNAKRRKEGVGNVSLFATAGKSESNLSLQLAIPRAGDASSAKIIAAKRIGDEADSFMQLAEIELPQQSLILAISVYPGDRVAFDWSADGTDLVTKVVEVKQFAPTKAEASAVSIDVKADCQILTK